MRLREPGRSIRFQTHRVVETDQYGHVTVGRIYASHLYAVAYRRHGRLDWRLHSCYRTSAECMEALAALKDRAVGASLSARTEDEATQHR